MTFGSYQRAVLVYLLLLAVVHITFAAFPRIDLAVSAWFAQAQGGFAWANGPMDTFNAVVRRTGELVAVAVLLGALWAALSKRCKPDVTRLVAFPALTVLVACIGVVNMLLKSHVGRARPHTVTEFGGTAQFSPPWQVVNECAANCSFTSGEVAMSASLAIPALVLVWPWLRSRPAQGLAVAVAFGYVVLTAVLRIGLGRHFLSDVIFSTLIAAAVALVLYALLGVRQAQATVVARWGASKGP